MKRKRLFLLRKPHQRQRKYSHRCNGHPNSYGSARSIQQLISTGMVMNLEQARRYAAQMAAVSRAVHNMVTVSTCDEIYTMLANSINEILPEVAAVIIGLYGQNDGPVNWTYAAYQGKNIPPDEVPDLLKELAGKQTIPQQLEPAGVFSGGKASPQPAVYVPLSTKEQIIGELQAYRSSERTFTITEQEILAILASTGAVVIQNIQLYDGLQKTNDELVSAYDATLESLARALELRDRETEGHTRRVAEASVRLGIRAGLQGDALVNLRRGAQLHDIGKMGVPDGILLKAHTLTKEEWVIMRRHTENAMEILQPIEYLKDALDIPHYHHERWDGTGYPVGLKGEEIPLAARIFAIVDVWDALTSDRPYREAWSKRRALRYVAHQSGKHFDPKLLKIFFEMMEEDGTAG
ncbi:MAG: HD domain-containing protein [Chloroflexi bacterium]|nr:HD domain-containing protein [Chloroflexota bacterium]